MSEQATSLAESLCHLNVNVGGHGDAFHALLPRLASAPNAGFAGSRRKVRGLRGNPLAGFNSRLSMCPLNDSGSELQLDALGSLTDASGPSSQDASTDQENTPPVLFAAPGHDKCWLGLQRVLTEPAPNTTLKPVAGALQPRVSRRPDAAADACHQSPAPKPKPRSHRRSSSNVNGSEALGLADSAEALHGRVDASNRPRSPSHCGTHFQHNGYADTHHLRVRTSSAPGDAQPPALSASQQSIAAYGIAAFGVPASVQSCFAGFPHVPSRLGTGAGSFGAPAPGLGRPSVLGMTASSVLGPLSQSGGVPADPQGAPQRSLQSAKDDHRFWNPQHLARSGAAVGQAGSCFNATSRGASGGNLSGILGTGGFHANSLADSAEELELRRMARQPVQQEPPVSAELGNVGQLSFPQSLSPTRAAGARPCGFPSPNHCKAAAGAVVIEHTAGATSLSCHSGPVLPSPVSGELLSPAPGHSLLHPTPYQRSGNMNTSNDPNLATPSVEPRDCAAKAPHRRDAGDDGNATDDEDGTWLRTSQAAPDPSDPASADKFSAVLIRRLQVAEREELDGRGNHMGLFGHLQEPQSAGKGEPSRRSPGSDAPSMEPSPMPRMSSRLRRLRASPHELGHTPSHLGTRSRSAGVTPGVGTGRRLRRRSHVAGEDFSLRHDIDDDDGAEEDAALQYGYARRCGTCLDELMSEANGCSIRYGAGSSMDGPPGRPLPPAAGFHVGYGMSDSFTSGSQQGEGVLRTAAWSLSQDPYDGEEPQPSQQPQPSHGSAGDRAQRPPTGSRISEHGNSWSIHPRQSEDFPVRRRQSRSLPGEDFLGGLMDYDDEGAEYSTPPHSPLRSFTLSQGNPTGTVPRGTHALGALLLGAAAPARGLPSPLSAAPAASPRSGGARIPGRAGRQQSRQGRVTFAGVAAPAAPANDGCCCEDELEFRRCAVGMDEEERSWQLARDERRRSHRDGSSIASVLVSSEELNTVQDYNARLLQAVESNERGTAEQLWHEMRARGVTPNVHTLNALLRCLSRDRAVHPDEAHMLVDEMCGYGGFAPNNTSERLLNEICFRFEQLHAFAGI